MPLGGVARAGSELDLDGALGRVDAGANQLAGLAVDAPGAQVAHAARAQAPDAAVADAHAAAEGQLRAGLLAGHEDRLLAVAAALDAARAERIVAARAALAVADVLVGLEVLDVQPRGIALALQRALERLQQAGRPAQERLALAPVGAQLVELARRSGGRARPLMPLVQPVSGVARVAARAAPRAKITASRRARAVDVDDVAQRAAAREARAACSRSA